MAKDMSLKEVSAILCRHPETLRKMAREGRLPGVYKLGREWFLRREALEMIRHGAGAKEGDA